MEKKVDLHTHSYCSDGTFSPEGLVILAKKQGLSAIALTDHDTTDGLSLFQEAGEKHQIETICGIEFAALWETYHHPEIHIVGLGIAPESPFLADALDHIKKSRIRRNEKMAAQLTAIGYPVSLEEVAENAGGEIITRAHFANVLLKKRLAKDRAEVFSRLISPGCPGYVEREFLTPKFCIETIHAAGGAAVLAHPTLYGLDMPQIALLCQELCQYGLDGIECFYSTYTSHQTKQMLKLAEEFHLLPSGGSDFHGENKPDIHLGTGKGNLSIPYALWQNLKDKTALYRKS